MGRRLLFLACILSMVILAGCIDSTTVIAVKKDGSGIVMETVYMSPALEAMMKEMMGGFAEAMGGETEDTEDDEGMKMPLEIAKYKTKALEMGEGVKFESAKELTRDDGAPGVQVIYSFEDIRKIKVSSDPDSPTSEDMGDMMPAQDEKGDPMTFDFVKGPTSRLIIQLPETEDEDLSFDEPEDDAETPDVEFGQAEMFKQMFQGFRVRALVKILDGEITKTNATYVDKIKGSQYVTLFDMNLGELVNMEEYLEKMGGMEKLKNMNMARKALQDVPGFKIEPENRIEINFK
jgi:hypothetical protein